MSAVARRPKTAPMDPEKLTSEDLHKAITQAFDHETGLGRSLTNIRVDERIFINGLHIQEYGLLADPRRPPDASVDEGVLAAATLHPVPKPAPTCVGRCQAGKGSSWSPCCN